MSQVYKIIPASVIYDVNNVSESTDIIKQHLGDYRQLAQDETTSLESRMQAWQFVKAYTQLLKDRKQLKKDGRGSYEG